MLVVHGAVNQRRPLGAPGFPRTRTSLHYPCHGTPPYTVPSSDGPLVTPPPLASPVRRPASRPLVRNVAASCPGPVLALSASSGTPLEENEGRHHHCVTGSSAACNTHRVGRCTVQTILGRSRGGSPPSKQRPGPSYESVLQGIFDGTPPRDRKLSRPRFSDRALSLAGIGR